MLLCAAWETYVENVALEVATRSIKLAKSPEELPKSIQRLITAHVRGSKDEGAWRSLAGRGWKDVAISLVQDRTQALNTPKPGPVRELFKGVLGIDDVTGKWSWAKNRNEMVVDRLSDFVTMRGAIAHGEILGHTVKKSHLNKQVDLIERLIPFVETEVLSWLIAYRARLKATRQ